MKDTMHKTNSFKKNNLRVGTVPPLSCAGVSRPRSVSTLFFLVLSLFTFNINSPIFAGNPGSPSFGIASWYSISCCKYNLEPSTCKTASGRSLYDLEREKVLFAASWDYAFGTRLKVTNVENGKSVVVAILDRGPNKKLGRSLDLSKLAFSKIADLKKGLITIKTEVL